MKKYALYTILLVLVMNGINADITEAGLNRENFQNNISTNVNKSNYTKDQSPSTYNFKMDH